MTRRLNWKTIKRFIQMQIAKENKNSLHCALSAGFGVFMSITPIWGFQILAAIPIAHIVRLNKAIVFIGTCFTLFPPIIPFVLYGSYKVGGWFMYNPTEIVSLDNITLDFVKTNFYQYLVGSMFVAAIAGSFVTLMVWFILSIKNKKK